MISSVTQSVMNVAMQGITVSGALATLTLFVLIGLKEFVLSNRGEGDRAGRTVNIFIFSLLTVLSFLIYVTIRDYVEYLYTW